MKPTRKVAKTSFTSAAKATAPVQGQMPARKPATAAAAKKSTYVRKTASSK